MTDPQADLVLKILRATHDGDNLSATELKILELGVNDRLNAAGWTYLTELHQRTTTKDNHGRPA